MRHPNRDLALCILSLLKQINILYDASVPENELVPFCYRSTCAEALPAEQPLIERDISMSLSSNEQQKVNM